MADFSEQALALDPLSFPEAYTLNAVANFRLKRLDAAEKSARKAQQMDSNHRNPKIHLLLADILYWKSDPAGSAGELREAPPSLLELRMPKQCARSCSNARTQNKRLAFLTERNQTDLDPLPQSQRRKLSGTGRDAGGRDCHEKYLLECNPLIT